MAASLQETLLTEENAGPLIADCQALVDQELARKSGASAAGIKVAYKAVTTFAPGYYQGIIGGILPPLVSKLEPFWADFTESGASSFGDHLAKRGNEVAEALLSVTDERAAVSDKKAVVKAYQAVRGSALTNVESALPNLGELVQKYAA
jgi:hypothetical protein